MARLTKVMIIRHAEKPDPKGKPHGVKMDGTTDDSVPGARSDSRWPCPTDGPQ
jgi:hypothetical protein